MDRFQAMLLFTRIVELKSFSRAADSLQLPRATASNVIRQLEARLGVRLLQRTTRQVSPTLDGSAYYERCRRLLADLDEAESSFDHSTAAPSGKLRVEMPGALGRLLVLPALPTFCRRYPGIELEISSSDRVIDLIQEGVDCALRGAELRDSTLVARRLSPLQQITCASRDYLDQYGVPQTLDELAQHLAVNYQSPTNRRILDLEFVVDGQLRTMAMQSRLTVNLADAYVTACEAGFGLIQVPRYHVIAALAEGRLVELLPEWQPPPLPLSVVYPQHRHLSPRLRVFVDWLVELFGAPA